MPDGSFLPLRLDWILLKGVRAEKSYMVSTAREDFTFARPGGALVLEIGWQQRQAVTGLLAAAGWTGIQCRQDYGGNDRCIIARA